MSGVIDPTKPAKYPVILSDALMGGTGKEIFTNIRYNHRPAQLSSETAAANARLRPSTAGSTSSYDLSFQDEVGKFAYAGTRVVNGNQYILYFDPSRKVFILDRVDSSFNMNLTRTPDNTNPESLAREFAQLDTAITVDTGPPVKSDKSSNVPASSPESPPPQPLPPPSKSKPKASKPAPKKEAPKKKTVTEKKKKQQKMELSFPTGAPVAKPAPSSPKAAAAAAAGGAGGGRGEEERAKKKKKKRRDPDSEDDEDEDVMDVIGLEVIGGPTATQKPGFSHFSPGIQKPGFPMRRFSEFVQENLRAESENESANDTDAEFDFKLPSPVGAGRPDASPEADGDDEGDSDADGDGEVEVEYGNRPKAVDNLEADLEAELNASAEEPDLEAEFAAELDKELREDLGAQNFDSESEVSEED